MKYKKAFTLIELMVVIAIISLLSAVVLNSLASAKMKANDTKIAQDLRQFRIAAELYYNDNHEYPTTAMDDQNKSFAINQSPTDWAHKLSFFIKTAEAAGHTKTLLCVNFDNAAEKMVNKKYLSNIPVHPYDNDEAGVCYKAINATTTFASYAVLTTRINSSSPLAQNGVINKSVGFIMGDTSSTGLQGLLDGTPVGEPLYPSGVDGTLTTNLTSSVNAIADVTDGASTLTSGLGGFIYYITNIFTPPGLPPVVIVPPPVILPLSNPIIAYNG
jgi:prepilin-type N-terminal cleavage/methylation domain-containing protein